MEEWLHFVADLSEYFFMDARSGRKLVEVLPQKLKQLWRLLVKAVRHYFARTPYSDQARDDAGACLRTYASLMEQWKFPAYMFTSNLHMVTCR